MTDKHYCYNCNSYFDSKETPTTHENCEHPQYNFGIVVAGLKKLTVDDYENQNLTPIKAVQYYFPSYTDEFAKEVVETRCYWLRNHHLQNLYIGLKDLYTWYTYNKHWDAYPMQSSVRNEEYYKRRLKEHQNQFK